MNTRGRAVLGEGGLSYALFLEYIAEGCGGPQRQWLSPLLSRGSWLSAP